MITMHHTFHPLYVNYCIYFNGNQDYFECHEVLEEYWKMVAPGDKNHILVGFVQLATGLYHWRRDNVTGAARILQKAYQNFCDNKDSLYLSPINQKDLFSHLENSIELVIQQKPFQAFFLNIQDKELKNSVQAAIKELPVPDNNYITHKHKLRDRSDILMARELKRRSRR